MGYFVVNMVSGPNWDPAVGIREQAGWDEHAAFMDGLVERGVVVLGGPIGEAGRPPVAMLVMEVASADEVAAAMADDPWKAAGVLHVGDVTPWTIWLDGRRAAG